MESAASPWIEFGQTIVNILAYADDLVIVKKSEDNLQRVSCILHQNFKEYNFETSTSKSITLAYQEKQPIRKK